MKVLLLQDIPGKGKKGEVKDVSDGYARNYLLKNRLAETVSSGLLNTLVAQKHSQEKKQQRMQAEHKRLTNKIQGQTVVIKKKVNDQGTLYAAITAEEVQKEVRKQVGIEIDSNMIHISEPIKKVDTFSLTARFDQNHSALFYVRVLPLQ